MSCKIVGIGGYLHGKPVSNFDLEKTLDTNDEWIRSRTGITQRYFTTESSSDMGYKASLNALNNFEIDPDTIDLIIVCSTTPDRAFPSTATTIQGLLGMDSIPSFDLNAVCSGFVYGLHVASTMLSSKIYKRILLIGVDKMSSVLDMTDRSTAVLFGDGAGAIILDRDEENLFDSYIGSDGKCTEILKTYFDKDSKQKIFMKGQEVYKNAVTIMTEMADILVSRNNLSIDQIDYFVPHQANKRIIESIADKLGMDMRKVVTTVSHHANTSSATIPLALDDMRQKNMLERENIILMTALGAGVTFGGAIIKY